MLYLPISSRVAYIRAKYYKSYAYIVLIDVLGEYWSEFWGNYDEFIIDTVDDHTVEIMFWCDHAKINVAFSEIFHITDINTVRREIENRIV